MTQLFVELIQQLREVEGVFASFSGYFVNRRGVYIMAIEWEKKVPEIVAKTDLLPRPNF